MIEIPCVPETVLRLKDIRVRAVPRLFHFKQPAGTSRGVYRERKVWYVVITSTDDSRPLKGIGECAPLYDLSCDYSSDYEERLRTACLELERNGMIDYESLRACPSILFGLETAMLSAKASLSGDCFNLFDTPFTRGEQSITINGLVWMGTCEDMLARMEEKLEQGFHCVKLKIGAIDFESELSLIARLRSRFSPDAVALRVDANGAFSVEDAPHKLECLSRYGIHSIEQPIRAGQWTEMARLCRTTPLPIALDEELIGIHQLEEKRQMLATIHPQYLVLKPSLHGGLAGSREWMREADKKGTGYWVTSALETNVGLNAIAQWTSLLFQDGAGGGHPGLEPTFPQGLGTGLLFTDNFPAVRLHVEGEHLWRYDKKERDFKESLRAFEKEWLSDCPSMLVHTSGSTGKPKPMSVDKSRMAASARRTCRFLGVKPGDTALLCMPLEYIAGKMMAVRAFVWGLQLFAVSPSSHPFAHLHFAPSFVAMTPMQVFETLQVPREKHLLKKVRCLIIGGGEISRELQSMLADFPHDIWSTYGMTETLSNVAMRRLNGKGASDWYAPLPGVSVSLTADGLLVIHVPDVCDRALVTNDRAELSSDGTFRLLGRADNVVCSGGLKLQIEQLEQLLSDLPCRFMLTSVPDKKYGEALVLLFEGMMKPEQMKELCRSRLKPYEVPKHYVPTSGLPYTATGKPARAEARAMAKHLLQESE